MSNKRNASKTPRTIGDAVRHPPVPFTRIYRDKNRYDRKAKYRGRNDE